MDKKTFFSTFFPFFTLDLVPVLNQVKKMEKNIVRNFGQFEISKFFIKISKFLIFEKYIFIIFYFSVI
jgi:hypothetical protein